MKLASLYLSNLDLNLVGNANELSSEPMTPPYDYGNLPAPVINRMEGDDYAADTTTTGVLILDGPSVAGVIEIEPDRDWFRLEIPAGEAFTVTMTSGTIRDTIVRLLNETGEVLAENDDYTLFGNETAALTYYADVDSVFYVSAEPYTVELSTGQIVFYNFTGTYTIGVVTTNSILGDGTSNIIHGTIGGDFIDGVGGSNKLKGDDGDDTIQGAEGDDELYGDNGVDYLYGNDGADTIYGGDGSDSIFGGNGDDLIYGGAGQDNISGGSGNDTIYTGDETDLTLTNYVDGGSGENVIYGGEGRDYLFASGGQQEIYGYGGNDSLFVNEPFSENGEGRSTGSHLLDGGDGDDDLTLSTEGIMIGGNGDDTLQIFGDRVEALGGNGEDFLWIDARESTVTGGEGYDLFRIGSGALGSDLNTITDLEIGEAIQIYARVDFIGTDAFTGNSSTSYEIRYEVSDGQTFLQIDRNRDKEVDGTIILSNGEFEIVAQPDLGSLIYLSILGTFVGSDFRNDSFTGTDGNDVMRGLDHNDMLDGGLGDDTLIGGGDNDILSGGAGNNIIHGGAGNDTANYANATENSDGAVTGITADLSLGVANFALGTDVLTQIENLIGSAFDDKLHGDFNANVLDGNAGNDQLFGDTPTSLSLSSFEGQIFRAYQAVFDRAPDLTGFTLFTRELIAGRQTQEDVITEFVGSLEFQQSYGELDNQAFMEQLYLNVLDRPGDAAGVTAFTNELDAGRSRASVVVELANSAEFLQLMQIPSASFATNVVAHPAEAEVYRIYQAVFDRAPDAAGFTAFVNSLQADILTVEEITTEFVGSAEFAQTYGALDDDGFIELLFTNVLPSNADPAGRAAYKAALESGALTRAQVVVEFAQSLELRDATADAVEAFVGAIYANTSDTLSGGEGADILFGGRGEDVFIYDTTGDGADIILDFTAGTDTLDLSGIDDFAALLAAGSQVNSDAVFDFGGGNTLTLANVDLSELTTGDVEIDAGNAQVALPDGEIQQMQFAIVDSYDWDMAL